ncbi:hypothetical protein [Guptibacillus algicola]|uniref:hypothetical protein n=1 Tax=Guptibacillus algicola TaxID=225844 RepID=UPI001CD6CDB9|nr:hypothetical protein [Alkalihalobacillus algicola]MCA0987287.1 hypothetical protein [Alkalihalobacillus algicola]
MKKSMEGKGIYLPFFTKKGLDLVFLRKAIKIEKSAFRKTVLQTTNFTLWIFILSILFLLGNLLLKVSTYGIETGMRSTALTFDMLSKPLFSPLIWSSEPKSNVLHFVVNFSVYYFLFTLGFWMKQYFKVVGTVLLLVFFIATGIWYYVYIVSNSVI